MVVYRQMHKRKLSQGP